MSQEFKQRLSELEKRLTGFRGRAVHQVPDIVFLNMLVDVFEHVQAAQLLAESEVPRTAYVCVRAAFEASQDLLLMVQDPAKYDENGAFARAFEVIENDEMTTRFVAADRVLGKGTVTAQENGRAVLEEDAKEWDASAPGKGKLLLDAYDQIKKDKRKHWSNLGRKKIGEAIGKADPKSAFAEINDSFYALLSIHSHPRPRTGMRKYEQTADDRYTLTTDDSDRKTPLELAVGALAMANGADAKRLLIP